MPTATDIAFAVGILSLLGKGVPPALRMLLLTVAIVDDIVAIFIIASTYSNGIELPGLALAGSGALLVWIMQRLRIRPAPAYILPGVLIWFGLLRAGIHPALAGVVLGLMAPANAKSNHLQRLLHPWVAYAIMPLFALANAGVSFKALPLEAGLPPDSGPGNHSRARRGQTSRDRCRGGSGGSFRGVYIAGGSPLVSHGPVRLPGRHWLYDVDLHRQPRLFRSHAAGR